MKHDLSFLAPSLAAPMQQQAIFADALRLMGRQVRTHTLPSPNNPLASGVMINRRTLGIRVGMVSRGPIWVNDMSLADKVSSFQRLAYKGCRIINAESLVDGEALQLAGFRMMRTPATIAEWDLQVPDLRGQLDGKWRNALRKAERMTALPFYKLIHRPFDLNEDLWLLAEEEKQRKNRGYATYSAELTISLARANPDAVRLYALTMNNQPRAAILIIKHGSSATYHLGWTSSEGRQIGAHNLLLWQAAKNLQAEGYKMLDLGTIDTENASGLARFKLNTGAKPRKLGGTWMRLSPFPASPEWNP